MNFKNYLLAVIFIISSKNVSAQICFTHEQDYQDSLTAIINEYPICSADFNNDGFNDVALAGDSIISIYFESASGINGHYYLRVPKELEDICSADFNNDGFKDIAVSDVNEVYIITGNGAGVMSISHTFTLALNISNMGTADLNGDGFQDITILSQASVTVLSGLGTGNFSPPANYSLSGNPSISCAGDFNGDGIQDIALVTSSSSVNGNISVLLGNASGPLSPAGTYSVHIPTGICSADFNGDGFDDLATLTGTGTGDDAYVLLSNSSGIFTSASSYTLGPANGVGIHTADFNGDGFKDLYIAESDEGDFPSEIDFLLGDGLGGFGNGIQVNTPYSALSTYQVVTDLNGDGKPDLVTNTMPSSRDFMIAYNCSSTSGIAGMNEPALSVYPNPCSNKLNIDFPGKLPQRITIYNVLGETVFEGTEFQPKNIQIDVSKYPQGVYSVSIDNEGKTTSKKLVIANP